MLSYEIVKNVSKKSGKPYMIIRLKFLLKDGTVYVLDKFATQEEQTILGFVADEVQIAEYLQTQEAF